MYVNNYTYIVYPNVCFVCLLGEEKYMFYADEWTVVLKR